MDVNKQNEPVAWRPILENPIPWVTGKPRASDITHWASQGCEIEYAYVHPSLVVATPAGCAVSSISSRMCERGTKGCVVEHEDPAVAVNDHLSERENAVLNFALRQFLSNTYLHMNAAAQDKEGKRYPKDASSKFHDDAKTTEALLERFERGAAEAAKKGGAV